MKNERQKILLSFLRCTQEHSESTVGRVNDGRGLCEVKRVCCCPSRCHMAYWVVIALPTANQEHGWTNGCKSCDQPNHLPLWRIFLIMHPPANITWQTSKNVLHKLWRTIFVRHPWQIFQCHEIRQQLLKDSVAQRETASASLMRKRGPKLKTKYKCNSNRLCNRNMISRYCDRLWLSWLVQSVMREAAWQNHAPQITQH